MQRRIRPNFSPFHENRLNRDMKPLRKREASGRSALPASDKIPPTPPTGTAPASDAAQKKHIAGVKYEDRTASNLDAGSKDAAKAPVSTLDAGSKDAAK